MSIYKIEGPTKSTNLRNRKKEIIKIKVHEGPKKKVGRPRNFRSTKCEICSQDFAAYSSLIRHIEIVHEGQKYFKCAMESCDKSYYMIETLKNHVNSVHLGKCFECEFCKKSYSQIPHLKRHINLVHKGRKDFKCSICEKLFGSKSHRNRHVVNVHKIFDGKQIKNKN